MWNEQDVWGTLREVRTNLQATFFMDAAVAAEQQEITYINAVWTLDAL